MPYQKSVQRVLAGSTNLRARATEIPGDDNQKSVNIAFDQAGGLRSRKGHDLICTASGSVSQMLRAMGSRWQATKEAYITGFKKYVWKMGAGEVDKACQTIISTTGPRKSDGTNDWRWIPVAPTDAPVIEAAEEVLTVVDEFTGGWSKDTDITVDEEGNRTDDDGNLLNEDGNPVDADGNLLSGFDALGYDYDSHGLRVKGGTNKVVSFTKSVELDLSDGFDLNDLFRVRLRAKKWSSIVGVSFDVDVNDGSFQKDYYKVRMPLKEILTAKKETVTFYIRKRLLEVGDAAKNKNRYGSFERIGSTTDKDWRSVVALRVKVEFSIQTKFWFSNWVMIGDADNTLEGDDFQVCYTYDTEDGHESNPSPWSDPIVVNHVAIKVTDMVTSGDEQVIGQNIYLRGGTLALPYRVNGAKLGEDGQPTETEPITGAEYTITANANELSDLDIVLEDDHDDPPDATGLADAPFYGRLLAFKDARFYWSHQNKPFAFANPDGPDGDWDEIDENAGIIKRMVVRFQQTRLYCENAILVLEGDPADALAVIHPSGVEMGTPSRFGVCKAVGGVDVAYLGGGIYLVDDSSVQKISEGVEPIFQGLSTNLWDGTVASPIGDPTTVAVGYEDGIIYVSYDNGMLAMDLLRRRWFQDSRRFTCFQAEGEVGLLGGQSSGKVLHLNTGNTDEGAAFPIDFLSKAYDCGISDNEKRWEDITIFHDTANQDLTVSIYPFETAAVQSVVINSGLRTRTVIQLNDGNGIRSRNLAVRITGDVTNPIFIDAIDINYYPEAREAKSYDTAVSDAGTPKVKLIREVQCDLENDGPVTVTVEGDVPGFALGITRESHTLTANPFRHTEPVVMTSPSLIYGHDFRVVASADSGHFHMFGVRALVQFIGTYLHGTKGEYYLSDPMDFGSERVKLVKEIEIIYATLGTVEVTIYTDLPGNAVVARGVTFLPATPTAAVVGGEQSIKIPLVGTIKGRLLQLKLEPSTDCRVEAIRFWMKMIGAPNATPWQWFDLPLDRTQDAIWVPLAFGEDQVA